MEYPLKRTVARERKTANLGRGIIGRLPRIWWCGIFIAGPLIAAEPTTEFGGANRISIAELQRLVPAQGQEPATFRVEGVVCAVVKEQNLVVLQDASATALLEVPALEAEITPGDSLAVEGQHCSLSAGRFGIQMGLAPVVINDGRHAPLLKSGEVWLAKGWQPFRLSWFNGTGASMLRLEYEGPGIARQKVPSRVFRQTARGADDQPGLAYSAYVANSWESVHDFARLKPVNEGVAADLDLVYRARAVNTGLIFKGYIEIPVEATYTFHLESDDGSELFVGDSSGACKLERLGRKASPVVKRWEGGSAELGWVEMQGQVVFAGHRESGLELEIITRAGRARATMIKSADSMIPGLLHRQIRAVGICQAARDVEQKPAGLLLIPGPAQIEVLDAEKGGVGRDDRIGTVLTTAEEIRRLRPSEARLGMEARISGVITWTSPYAVVIQDSSGGGVYTQLASDGWNEQPQAGDLWEIVGTTAPGDFSPVIRSSGASYLGHGIMPDPMHPTWDQLMNGSLDAQYVEIRGVVTAVSQNEMTLLTPDGKLRVRGNSYRPLIRLPKLVPGGEGKVQGEAANAAERKGFVDSLVRLRGVLTAEWDAKTKQVRAGIIYMGTSIIDIEEPGPTDPFAIPIRRTADLLRFDARAGALHRAKVAGQVIYARPHECWVLDEQSGLRFLMREAVELHIGDLVEGVGFPQLGGASPVLLETQVRKTGSAPLPIPVPVSGRDLLDRNLDSRLVQLEAVLINDAEKREGRVLELKAGPHHFRARIKPGTEMAKPIHSGSRLRLSGVYSSARGESPDENRDPFELLVANDSAIAVLEQPPWWTMQRALTMVAVLAGGLGVALVWITLLRRKVEERTAQLQKQIEERQMVEQRRVMEQERTRVAQDLHDELGSGLTEVGILGSLAKNPSVPPSERERYLDRLTEAARSLVTGLDEIVWAVNPHYDSVASLASYYSLFAQRFLNLAGIACRLQIAEQFPEHPLDSRLRHGIFLAFKEALNNVVRHSEATEVGLLIQVSGDELRIAVTDNGRGLESAPQVPGSDGLAGMRARIGKLGGQCEINSKPGRGTTVEFRLPLEKMCHDQSRDR